MRRAALALVALAACHGGKPKTPSAPLSRAAYAHYFAGKMAMYGQDWPGAISELVAARAAAPGEPMIVVSLALAQARSKDVAHAKATLVAAEKRWPDHPEIWIAAGDLLAETAKPEAIAAYRKAIELAPADERGYLGLAKLDPDHAETTLHTLVAHVPDSVEGHYRLAVRFEKREELAAAIVELRAVLERDADHIDARLDLARALRRTGHLDEAVLQTRGAFDRAAQPLDVAEELFWLLVEADDQTGAIDLLTLLDDDRSDLDGLAMIARLQRGLGRLAEARAVADKIARLDGDVGAIAFAEIDFAGGKIAAALAELEPVFASKEHGLDARRLAAEIELADGKPQLALDVLAPARTAKPAQLELATLAAFALADLGRQPEARAVFAKSGDSPDAKFAIARALERGGDRAGALAILEPLIAAHPDASSALNLTGYLLVQAGRLPAAIAPLHRARDLAPGDPAVLDSWGVYLLRAGKVADAIAALTRATRYAPLEAEIAMHLAEAYAANHVPRSAIELLDRATTLRPSPAVARRIAEIRQAIAAGR